MFSLVNSLLIVNIDIDIDMYVYQCQDGIAQRIVSDRNIIWYLIKKEQHDTNLHILFLKKK